MLGGYSLYSERLVSTMAKTELVPITAHVPKWVREAFQRCAKEDGITVSKAAAFVLIENCQDDPENPANQPRGGTPFVTGEHHSQVSTNKRPPPPAAPPGPQPDYRPRHVLRTVEEMPDEEAS